MGFNLESGKNGEINETSEIQVDSEQLSETEETAENFDDCFLNEVQDSKGNEINAESLEDVEEDYDDCEAKMEEIEEKNPELVEENDNFNDCGKEINSNEYIEVQNAEVVEQPENSEMGKGIVEEEYEEIQQELDEAQESLEVQQEVAQEHKEDLENQVNKHGDKVPEGTENSDEVDETTEETEDSDEVKETTEETEDSGEEDETTEGAEGSDEVAETTEETEDSEDEEIGTTDSENMDDDSKVEISEINEESLSENVSQEVEEKTDTELCDKTKEQITEEIFKEINSEAENNKISAAEIEEIIKERKAETMESLDEQSETMDDEINQKVDEIAEQDNLTEEEAKEQISEEISETTSENIANDDVEAMVEEKSEDIEKTIKEKKEEQEVVIGIKKNVEDFEDEKVEQLSEQSEQSLQKRIDSAFEKEDVTVSEINSLRNEHSVELQTKIKEKITIEAELKIKFDEVLSKEKGNDEYQQLLQEYNALRDKKSELDDKIVTMEKQQDILEKKSIELREAQIQKGLETMVASNATLAGVNMLQERYDQTYYNPKADKAELASIRDKSCSAIKELSVEKDSIKQAMAAKMDEISEYVTSTSMERDDTAHDWRYQQISAEYNAMKESYDRIDYTIVKLDENNKFITECIGDEYVSMVELPPISRVSEVNDGTDVPGETNYFIDEAKSAEVLSPFKQESWEQLSIREQKQAINKLADYNAGILGVEDKPRIIYYNAEDPCDFGGYSAKQNAIYINEYNIHDAVETVDTISHEYRHKYQHERAEKLETERDLEFKNSFDNYIRAEDDYQDYKEQLVEADARAYAQIVKDKISFYSENIPENIDLNGEKCVLEDKFTKLHPEKGAVFEKVSVNELPDDFEQKDRIKYKEILEAKELDELRDVASVHYENGKRLGDKIPEFNTYKEHHDIESGHIEKVRIKSLEAADALELHFSQNNYNGLYSPNIDRRTIEVMSIYHDTGMDGNIKVEDYETERAIFISDKSIREKFVANILDQKEKEAVEKGKIFERETEEKKANEKFGNEGFENHFRPNHSLESAIHALRDRDSISKLGVNADEVALGCLVHSKSNSGLRNIASEDEWRVAVGRLRDRVNKFNQSHSDDQIYFDSSFILNKDDSFNQEKLAEMRSEAIVLRIGDANGHDTNSRISQNGKAIEFTLEEKTEMDELPSDFESKFENGDYEAYFIEIQSADVEVDGVELNNANDPKGISRMFIVGEGNFQSLNCEAEDNGTIKENFELCDGNAFPLSTQHCIEERLGEYKTAQPMNYTPVVKLGNNCRDEVYESYLAFVDRIERDYNVRMEVVR